mmetsp:Transcript_16416/g.20991  ORF Transcript_16416/g.20991 Transcript_16416/m.20991 type:complete len:167 (-) Transcript_16416:750-1250(-)
MNGEDRNTNHDLTRGDLPSLREQDRFLPIANINRIMKMSLPKDGKIAKDAKENVQECVSEFISFITSEASEKCLHEKRKTINGDDILCAMQTLGFDTYHEPLKNYLQNYRTHNDKSQPPPKKDNSQQQNTEMNMFPPNSLLPQNVNPYDPKFGYMSQEGYQNQDQA